jgi:hypothetical protein
MAKARFSTRERRAATRAFSRKCASALHRNVRAIFARRFPGTDRLTLG